MVVPYRTIGIQVKLQLVSSPQVKFQLEYDLRLSCSFYGPRESWETSDIIYKIDHNARYIYQGSSYI